MTRPAEQVCVNAQFHGDSPRRAADGAYLCPGCVDWLRRAIGELPPLHADLEEALHGSRTAGGNGPVSGTPEDPLPGNLAAAAHMAHIVGVLASWCRVVAEDRGLTGPGLPDGGSSEHDPSCPYVELPKRRGLEPEGRPAPVWNPQWRSCPRCGWVAGHVGPVAALAAWLGGHVDWLAAQLFADDVLTEVRAVRGRGFALLDPSSQPRQFVIGGCPEGECGGRLYAYVADADSLLPSALLCDTTPEHEWATLQWLALGRRLHGAA